LILLILIIIALISMLIGYRQAATVAAVIINGGLIIWIVYAIINYAVKKMKPKAPAI
jgi:Ca2+/Na+ antiporter